MTRQTKITARNECLNAISSLGLARNLLPIYYLKTYYLEERGTIETAHRTLQICGQVFRYAVAAGRIDRDITTDLRGALPSVQGGHFSAITEPKQAMSYCVALTDTKAEWWRKQRYSLPHYL